jgi:hypothetical protein
MVFGSSTDQSNSSYINLLYSFRNGDINLGYCVFERIEVADDIIDFVDTLFGKIFLIRCKISGEDTCMNLM